MMLNGASWCLIMVTKNNGEEKWSMMVEMVVYDGELWLTLWFTVAACSGCVIV